MVRVKRPSPHLLLFTTTVFLLGCGGDSVIEDEPPIETESNETIELSVSQKTSTSNLPSIVYIEELDQFQEYFKEQHDTSFSHTRNKNYCSFTAGKAGMPMRIALYGKAHFATSDFYGSSMSGVLRENDPDRGRKIATWSLSRQEVVAQLSSQGLSDIDYGWIDIKFQDPTDPLVNGRKYFFVCERIADGKHFFGAFSFGEGNPYAGGRHWLHPEHDLVFRSYVGNEEKTAIEEPVSNNTKSPLPNVISISPSVPTPQYSDDKKIVAPPLTPDSTPRSPEAPPVLDEPLDSTPLIAPQGLSHPRPRSVIPLENDRANGISEDESNGIKEEDNDYPLPPPLPNAKEINATRDSDSSKTKRRGLLPDLFPRK